MFTEFAKMAALKSNYEAGMGNIFWDVTGQMFHNIFQHIVIWQETFVSP